MMAVLAKLPDWCGRRPTQVPLCSSLQAPTQEHPTNLDKWFLEYYTTHHEKKVHSQTDIVNRIDYLATVPSLRLPLAYFEFEPSDSAWEYLNALQHLSCLINR